MTSSPPTCSRMRATASAMWSRMTQSGRAPAMRWGQGSLQEIDHVPFVAPLTKLAATPDTTAEIPGLVDDAFLAAQEPHGGPAFVDFPLDLVDPVQHSIGASASGEDASEVAAQLFADSLGIGGEGADQELDDGRRHTLGQARTDSPGRRRGQDQLVDTVAHDRKARTAWAPRTTSPAA